MTERLTEMGKERKRKKVLFNNGLNHYNYSYLASIYRGGEEEEKNILFTDAIHTLFMAIW